MKGISILEEVREDRGLGRNTLHKKKHKNLAGRGNKKKVQDMEGVLPFWHVKVVMEAAVSLIRVGSTRRCIILLVAPFEVLVGILVVSVVAMHVILGSGVFVVGIL
jgi:hypothetical protein